MDEAGTNRKFIGGAEQARRRARKRLRTSHEPSNGTSRYSNCSVIPKSVKPSERFFASLLKSNISQIARSNESTRGRDDLMLDVCARLNLPLPAKLPPTYKDAHSFYSSRASLVLEEARYVLSEALLVFQKRWKSKKRESMMSVSLVSMIEQKKTGHVVLTFTPSRGTNSFIAQETYDMKPGTVFLVTPRKHPSCDDLLDCSLLGSFTYQSFDPNGMDEQSASLSLMNFQTEVLSSVVERNLEGEWAVTPLTSLIGLARQFEACSNRKTPAFLPKLLGWKESSHVRFDSEPDDDDEEIDNGNQEDSDVETELDIPVSPVNEFVLPSLNAAQEKAAMAFLDSPPSSLALVQGPPGTGKTTFLVSTLARCLQAPFHRRRRILVAAPTNKAIEVLATRFLSALNGSTTYNVVMIGVQEKLVPCDGSPDKGNSSTTVSSPLKRYFVYTWMEAMVEDLESLRLDLNESTSFTQLSSVCFKAKRLVHKLTHSIPSMLNMSGGVVVSQTFIKSLDEKIERHDHEQAEVMQRLDELIGCVRGIDYADAVHELLATANVVFSTLSSSGVSAMKQTKRIDDLFVDEAAAATEPEICIPFHLNPDRMLAVGDPMQLPATVLSSHAGELGLCRSMHERLMIDCRKDYVMLDIQYRMKPAISLFPSNRFYHGKLINAKCVVSPEYKPHTPVVGGNPYAFIQVEGCEQRLGGGSYSNKHEATTVVEIVKDFEKQSRTITGGSEPWHSRDKIRIITFYQGQVALISQLLRQHGLGQVLVASVDSSQGCEADLVILSFVRSSRGAGREDRSSKTGFLSDDRRINVAMTRARYQLVCVGDANGTLGRSPSQTLRSVVNDAYTRLLVKKPIVLDSQRTTGFGRCR